jgi:hypothetical protein
VTGVLLLDPVEIMQDLMYEVHHHVHVPRCKCQLATRKLRAACAYLRPIHWAGMKDGECSRKDSGVDITTEKSGPATITHLAIASHYGNITCLACRKAAWKAGIR